MTTQKQNINVKAFIQICNGIDPHSDNEEFDFTSGTAGEMPDLIITDRLIFDVDSDISQCKRVIDLKGQKAYNISEGVEKDKEAYSVWEVELLTDNGYWSMTTATHKTYPLNTDAGWLMEYNKEIDDHEPIEKKNINEIYLYIYKDIFESDTSKCHWDGLDDEAVYSTGTSVCENERQADSIVCEKHKTHLKKLLEYTPMARYP